MKKRLLTFGLCLCMMLSLIPAAFASGKGPEEHQIQVIQMPDGTVFASEDTAPAGTPVYLLITPDFDYSMDRIEILDENNQRVASVVGEDEVYFIMPDSDVTVRVYFSYDPQEPPFPFTDVPETAWYYDSVLTVYQREWMYGVTETTFCPDDTITRGMVVAILYRLHIPDPKYKSTYFEDVSPDAYYAEAIEWAAYHGIVAGYGNGQFGPDDPITREQLAAILYRYADFCGLGMNLSADLSGFTDADTISNYAKPALSWANARELIVGTSPTTLSPQDTATRAETAAILVRFSRLLIS